MLLEELVLHAPCISMVKCENGQLCSSGAGYLVYGSGAQHVVKWKQKNCESPRQGGQGRTTGEDGWYDKPICVWSSWSLHLSQLSLPEFNCNSSQNCLLSFSPVTEEEVFHCLRAVDIQKATGPDGVPGDILTDYAVSVSPFLTQVINMSLNTGLILEGFKQPSSCQCLSLGNSKR